MAVSASAAADLLDDAVHVVVESRDDSTASPLREPATSGTSYVDVQSSILVAAGPTLADVQELTRLGVDPGPIRICAFVQRPPVNGPHFSLPATLLASPPTTPTTWPWMSCVDDVALAAESYPAVFQSGQSGRDQVLFAPGSLRRGDQVTVQVWIPVGDSPAPADANYAREIEGRRSRLREVAGDRFVGGVAGRHWIKIERVLRVWEWDRYDIYPSSGGDFRGPLGPTETETINLTPSEEVVLGLPGTSEYDAEFTFDDARAFENICVQLVRFNGTTASEDDTTTDLGAQRHLYATDRRYAIRGLPLGETAELRWGQRVVTSDGTRCIRWRHYRILRRNVGPYLTYPAVSEVVAAVANLDANDLRAHSSTGFVISCDFARAEGTLCLPALLFPLVVSWDFHEFALSEFLGIYVGAQFTAVESTGGVSLRAGVSFGARVLNSIFVGSTYHPEANQWLFTVGGDVTGLPDLLRRAL
jgi:hypothetical protein